MSNFFASLFDLDHTLLKKNVSFQFGKFLYKKGFFSTKTMLSVALLYSRHKYFSYPLQDLHQNIFENLFLGKKSEQIERYAAEFLNLYLPHLLYTPAINKLKKAQQDHHYTVILSSSPQFLVEPIANRLKVSSWKSSMYAKDRHGKFTHIESLCEGEHKAQFVKTFSEKYQLSRSKITAYSDSILDLPFLKAAGSAVAVKPSKQLYQISLREGWEII